jgi:hypothetical protein
MRALNTAESEILSGPSNQFIDKYPTNNYLLLAGRALLTKAIRGLTSKCI